MKNIILICLIDFIDKQGPKWVAQMAVHAGVQPSINALTTTLVTDYIITSCSGTHSVLPTVLVPMAMALTTVAITSMLQQK